MEQIFNYLYKNQDLLTIIDKHNKAYFSGNDVSRILGIKQGRRSILKVVPIINRVTYEDIEVDKKEYTKEYPKEATFINIAGLFRMIFKSKMKAATDFQTWVTDTLLPDLYSKGYYIMKEEIESLNITIARLQKQVQYLRKKDFPVAKNGFLYCIQVVLPINGKLTFCYKFGETEDLKKEIECIQNRKSTS